MEKTGVQETAKSYKKYLDKKRKTVDISNIDDNKIAKIYEQCAPKNISLQEFKKRIKEDPDLLNAEEFSTFNPELAKLRKKVLDGKLSEYDFRNKLKKSINSKVLNANAEKYAKMFEDLLRSNDDMLMYCLTFNTLNDQQRKDLAVAIVNHMNKFFNLEDKLKVFYIQKKKQQPFKYLLKHGIVKIAIRVANIFKRKKYEIQDWAGYYDKSNIVLLSTNHFMFFCNILAHEYGHFIDEKYPDLGVLGSQIASYGEKLYSSIEGEDIYKSNPTEVSSYKIGEAVEKRIFDVWEETIEKRPALYAKALETNINYEEMKLAALRFKHKKTLNAVKKAEQNYQNAKEAMFKKMYPNIDMESTQDVNNAVSKVNNIPKVQKLYLQYRKMTKKIPEEIETYQKSIEYNKRILNRYKSDEKFFVKHYKDMLAGRI